jgi:hypothetical protein
MNLLETRQRVLESRQCELAVQLKALQHAGRELDTEHDDLKGQRRDLEDALIRATGFPCTIPPEIISLIFLYCVEYPSDLFLPRNPALYLTPVCRKWGERWRLRRVSCGPFCL